MVQSIPHHAQNWIAGIAGKSRRFRDVADFDRGENFFDSFGIAPEPTAAPPEDSLDHNRQGDDGHDENRPHDRSAFAEIIDDEIVAPAARFRSRRCGWTRTDRRRNAGARRNSAWYAYWTGG